MNTDQIRDKEFERKAVAVAMLHELDTERAWEWLNRFSDNGNFFDSDELDQIFKEFAPKTNGKATIHNFTDDQIRNIRACRKAGMSLKQLAHEFGCSKALISKIARGIIYKEVK